MNLLSSIFPFLNDSGHRYYFDTGPYFINVVYVVCFLNVHLMFFVLFLGNLTFYFVVVRFTLFLNFSVKCPLLHPY